MDPQKDTENEKSNNLDGQNEQLAQDFKSIFDQSQQNFASNENQKVENESDKHHENESFNIQHLQQKYEFLIDLNEKISKFQEEIESCDKIHNLLSQQYKTRAYAISQEWINKFQLYFQYISELKHNFNDLLQQSDGNRQSSQINIANIEDEKLMQFEQLYQVASTLRPGPVENFDLVYLSPQYSNKMKAVLNELQTPNYQLRDFKDKDMFQDWSQMSLNDQYIGELQKNITQQYQEEFQQFPNSEYQDFDNNKIKLIDQLCWSKITYIFGLVGPEILFFCQTDPVTQQYMPDLEPIKIQIFQYDQNFNQITNFKQKNELLVNQKQFSEQGGFSILVSGKITSKQLNQYLALDVRNRMQEVSHLKNQTFLLINKDANNLKDMMVEIQDSQQNDETRKSRLRTLNLLTKDSLKKLNNQKKQSLIDLGFKDGSSLCIVNNIDQRLTLSMLQRVKIEMFTRIGQNFNIEGSTIYQLQNNNGYQNEEEIIQEESPDEAEYQQNQMRFDQQQNFGEFYDQADSNLNAFTDDYEIQQKGSSYQSIRSNKDQERNKNYTVRQRGTRKPQSPQKAHNINNKYDGYISDQMLNEFGKLDAKNQQNIVPKEYQDDPDLYWAIQASLQESNIQQNEATNTHLNDQRGFNNQSVSDISVDEILDVIDNKQTKQDQKITLENLNKMNQMQGNQNMFDSNNDSMSNIHNQVSNNKNQQTMKTPSTGENLSTKNFSSSFEQIGSDKPANLQQKESMKNIFHGMSDDNLRNTNNQFSNKNQIDARNADQKNKFTSEEKIALLMKKKRELLKNKFIEQRQKSIQQLFTSQNTCIQNQESQSQTIGNTNSGQDDEPQKFPKDRANKNQGKESKKKNLQNAFGQPFYYIQPLSHMSQLKNFQQCSVNLKKLSLNIFTRGVDDAIMKIGQEFIGDAKDQIQYLQNYQQIDLRKYQNHQSSQFIKDLAGQQRDQITGNSSQHRVNLIDMNEAHLSEIQNDINFFDFQKVQLNHLGQKIEHRNSKKQNFFRYENQNKNYLSERMSSDYIDSNSNLNIDVDNDKMQIISKKTSTKYNKKNLQIIDQAFTKIKCRNQYLQKNNQSEQIMQEIETRQQNTQIFENLSAGNTDNTGKTQCEGSDKLDKRREKNNVLDDIEEDFESDTFDQKPMQCDVIDELSNDIAKAKQNQLLVNRDRVYSSSGVIIEGFTQTKKKKMI